MKIFQNSQHFLFFTLINLGACQNYIEASSPTITRTHIGRLATPPRWAASIATRSRSGKGSVAKHIKSQPRRPEEFSNPPVDERDGFYLPDKWVCRYANESRPLSPRRITATPVPGAGSTRANALVPLPCKMSARCLTPPKHNPKNGIRNHRERFLQDKS